VRSFLTRCAAQYLGQSRQGEQVLDPVARFHLGNGARIERINWFADPSSKGVKQSYGLMVNYLYDLKRLDKHRHMLDSGETPASSDVQSLYFK
jgi:malonyl-CoA decarboxylase